MWTMNIGGAERAVYQLIREQRRNAIDANLLVGHSVGHYGKLASETGAQVLELGQKNALDFSVGRRFKELIHPYDIIHFHCAEVSLMHLASRFPTQKKFYSHRAGLFQYPFKQNLKYKLAGYLIKKYFTGISANTSQAACAASRLFRIPLDKIPVVYNGIDFSLLEPKRPKEEVLRELHDTADDIVRIGTSGNLRDWKRIDRLLEAVAQLRGEKLHCYIIGDGPEKSALESQAKELGILDHVTFTGKKEHIGDFLQILDIFALPSGPQESFGNSAVEAMGVGLPTIVFSDGGGLVEHIEHEKTGFVVHDITDCVKTIRKLIADKALLESIRERAMLAVKAKYTLHNMFENYNNLYAGY